MHDQRIDLPAFALRVLHSGWIDWLDDIGETGLRDSFIIRAGGVDFKRWLLALGAGKFAVTVRIEQDDAVIGLALRTDSGEDRALYEMSPRETGLRPEYVLALATVDLDEEIEELLGTER